MGLAGGESRERAKVPTQRVANVGDQYISKRAETGEFITSQRD